MKSPFVRASCGCIVIPLHRESTQIQGMMDCICVKACDTTYPDNSWGFHIQPMEPWKVVHDPNHKYHERHPLPQPLTEEETEQTIRQLGNLVILGFVALDINRTLSHIGRVGEGVKE